MITYTCHTISQVTGTAAQYLTIKIAVRDGTWHVHVLDLVINEYILIEK